MSDDTAANLPTWLEAGGGVAGILGVLVWPYRALSGRIRRLEDGRETIMDTVRRDREAEDGKLWTAVEGLRGDITSLREKVATREEIRDMFRDHERRMGRGRREGDAS